MAMIDTSDSRFPKAVAIADQAGQWLKCRTPDGRKAYGVPSQCTPGRYYLVTQASCTCEDAARHPGAICKHALAVQIHCARLQGKPMPASDVVDGLVQMVSDRAVTWDRREGVNGESIYLPHWQPPAPTATEYDRIFKRFEGD